MSPQPDPPSQCRGTAAWPLRDERNRKARAIWTHGCCVSMPRAAMCGSGHDEALSVTVLPDGGLAVAGWTTAKGAGGADAWVIRRESDARLQ
jgi:hypothetical protein